MLAFFDLRPFFFVGGLPAVALLAWAVWHYTARRWNYPTTLLVATVVYAGLFWLFLAGPFVGQRREMHFAMIRTPNDVSLVPAGPGWVTLTFRDYPDQYLTMDDADLARALDQRTTPEVDAVIEVTLDYGHTRGFRLLRVGETDTSHFAGDGSLGRVGNGTSTPFP